MGSLKMVTKRRIRRPIYRYPELQALVESADIHKGSKVTRVDRWNRETQVLDFTTVVGEPLSQGRRFNTVKRFLVEVPVVVVEGDDGLPVAATLQSFPPDYRLTEAIIVPWLVQKAERQAKKARRKDLDIGLVSQPFGVITAQYPTFAKRR